MYSPVRVQAVLLRLLASETEPHLVPDAGSNSLRLALAEEEQSRVSMLANA